MTGSVLFTTIVYSHQVRSLVAVSPRAGDVIKSAPPALFFGGLFSYG